MRCVYSFYESESGSFIYRGNVMIGEWMGRFSVWVEKVYKQRPASPTLTRNRIIQSETARHNSLDLFNTPVSFYKEYTILLKKIVAERITIGLRKKAEFYNNRTINARHELIYISFNCATD